MNFLPALALTLLTFAVCAIVVLACLSLGFPGAMLLLTLIFGGFAVEACWEGRL